MQQQQAAIQAAQTKTNAAKLQAAGQNKAIQHQQAAKCSKQQQQAKIENSICNTVNQGSSIKPNK